MKGRQDKYGNSLSEGDKARVLIASDGYQHRRVADAKREAPFEGTVVGFSGIDQVVVEDNGLRYSAACDYVERTDPPAPKADSVKAEPVAEPVDVVAVRLSK
jgi:hypothetical protein